MQNDKVNKSTPKVDMVKNQKISTVDNKMEKSVVNLENKEKTAPLVFVKSNNKKSKNNKEIRKKFLDVQFKQPSFSVGR